MNRLLYLPLLLLLACNNSEKADPETTDTPAKELELKNAVKQYPDSALLVQNLVTYYWENGNYNQAISNINEALVKDSLNAGFWDIKTNLHLENKDTLGAINAFEHLVSINPQPDAIMALGVLYAHTGNPLAIIMADGLLQADKAKAEKEAYFIKGLYHGSIGDKKTAISFFDQSLTVNYSFVEAYREKAITLYDMGQYKEALAVLDKAVTLQNGFDEGYYYKGRCLEKLNRVPEAIEMYQRALMYDPNYVEAKEALGRLGIKS